MKPGHPNPYAVLGCGFDSRSIRRDDFSEKLDQKFEQERFRLVGDQSLRGVDTTVWWKRFLWLPLPTICRFFIKRLDPGETPTVESIVEFDQQSLQQTNAEHPFPPWLRFQIPITVTVVVSDCGFNQDVVGFVTNNKLCHQVGQPHALVLIDLTQRSIHFLDRAGPSLNLSRAHKMACRVFDWIQPKE